MEKLLLGQTPDGQDIFGYTLTNKNGMKAKIMNYGGNLMELWVPFKEGLCDVVLGYEKLEDYFVNTPGFGCCIMPNGNRIGEAKFTLNGVEYKLDVNDGKNNLHSGFNPMHKTIYEVAEVDDMHIKFTGHKNDGDMGFPGNMDIAVTYTLGDDNSIRIDYEALSDADTVFNPTNHSYFNLAGHNAGSVLDEYVTVDADNFTWADEESIPHGEIVPVKGTPMDFTVAKPLGQDIDADYDELTWAKGLDHNFCLNNPTLDHASCVLEDKKLNRKMEVFTDLPGVHVYAGNYLTTEHIGKGGFTYDSRYGVCFETQFFPNAVNVPTFVQPIAKANVKTGSSTIFKFS